MSLQYWRKGKEIILEGHAEIPSPARNGGNIARLEITGMVRRKARFNTPSLRDIFNRP
jgi:hypothetical protein